MKEVTCPECDHQFDPRDRCWRVCWDCLSIIPPEDNIDNHKPDNCVKELGGYHRKYSQEAAEEHQEKLLQDYDPE